MFTLTDLPLETITAVPNAIERLYQDEVIEPEFWNIVGRIGMLQIAAFGSAMLADND